MTEDPDPATHERQVAEYKASVCEFETYLGVENVLPIKIKKTVDPKLLEAIRSSTLGFTHATPMAMLTHLHNMDDGTWISWMMQIS